MTIGSSIIASHFLSSLSRMDIDLLISEVFARPTLWDKKDNNHHNRFVLDKLWNKVAVKLKTKATIVRNKWKSLRDKFRATLASIPKPESGDTQLTDYTGEWKYFKSLFFLKDQFTPRKTSGNLIENNEHESILEDDSDNNYDSQNCLSMQKGHIGYPQDISSAPSSPRPSSAAGQKYESEAQNSSRKRNIDDALLSVEREKLQFLQEKRSRREENDEDLNFFKSLLPHVRLFSAYDKMEYRMRVMKVTQEFLK